MSERAVQLLEVLHEPSSALLPPELEAQRLQALGAEYSVKGDPRKPPGNPVSYKDSRDDLGELEAVQRSILNPHDIHAMYDGPGDLALVRKSLPHGMYEMSVFAQAGYDGAAVDNVFGFAPEIRHSFWEVGARFSHFSEGEGRYPLLSYTFDPQTRDRKPPQSVKTFHLQLTARSQEELREMAADIHPLVDYDVTQQRQLIDESSIVCSLMLGDYFRIHPVGSLIPIDPFTQDGCSNIRFCVGDTWDCVLTEEFDDNLRSIHETLVNLFADFTQATMSGSAGKWQRSIMDSEAAYTYIDGLEWMQPDTKTIVYHFITGLHTHHLRQIQTLQKLGMATHVYPVADFCYGAAINRNNTGQLMLSIRPQFFAGGGGTGLQYMDPIGAQIMMTKGSGTYTDEEVETKAAFEASCAAYITQRQ